MAKLIGTAGHVDHGKTSLIKALTGIDADRLREEKERGMTIEIGFAFLDLPRAGRVSIVDVPGHEKLITNMLVGAMGMDIALLCVSADAGVMPQTKEHLQIIDALQAEAVVVALTRCDIADEETQDLAALDITEHLESTRFANAPIIRTSATTGFGLEELRSALDSALCDGPQTAAQPSWYLSVDRVFTVKGHGTVVTGTVSQGTIKVGEPAELMPAGIQTRIRSIQSHGESVQQAERGMRAALNLQGVSAEQVQKGMQLGSPGTIFKTDVIDAELRLSAPLKHAQRIRLAIGSEEAIGKAYLNDHSENLVQIRLETAVAATRSQPILIRNYSPPTLLGGGKVLVPVAKVRKKSDAVQQLDTETDDSEAILAALSGKTKGVPTDEICRIVGRAQQALGNVFESLRKQDKVIGFAGLWYESGAFESAKHEFLQALMDVHQARSNELWQNREDAVQKSGLGWSGKPLDRIVAHLVELGLIHSQGNQIRHADFRLQLQPKQELLLDRVITALDGAGVNVPNPTDLAGLVPAPIQAIEEIIRLGLGAGKLVRIEPTIVYSQQGIRMIQNDLRERFGSRPFTAAECRDAWNSTRKYVIPLLEYFDSIQFTVRSGDNRIIRPVGS